MTTALTGQSVRDLQEMLQTLSEEYPQIPSIIPDGIFGEWTLEAVMVFQRDFHPPVTGIVDHGTWSAIYRAYRDTLRRQGPPSALRVMPHSRAVLQEGDRPEQVWLIQAMFDSLRGALTEFEQSGGDGVFQEATRRNTARLQKRSGMPATGVMDRAAWDALARLYHVFVTRKAGGTGKDGPAPRGTGRGR